MLAIADVAGRATITVPEAAELIGVGRSAAYEAARRGQLPTRRVGRSSSSRSLLSSTG